MLATATHNISGDTTVRNWPRKLRAPWTKLKINVQMGLFFCRIVNLYAIYKYDHLPPFEEKTINQ